MKNAFVFLIALLAGSFAALCQQPLQVAGGSVRFKSEAPAATITAVSRSVSGLLDLTSGAVAVEFPVREFQFESRLMRQHFLSDFAHGDQHPRAGFSGRLLRMEALDKSCVERQAVEVEGIMTFHGLSRKMKIAGTLQQRGSQWLVEAEFPLALADFDVRVPAILQVKIAPVVQVSVALACQAAGSQR